MEGFLALVPTHIHCSSYEFEYHFTLNKKKQPPEDQETSFRFWILDLVSSYGCLVRELSHTNTHTHKHTYIHTHPIFIVYNLQNHIEHISFAGCMMVNFQFLIMYKRYDTKKKL